MTRLINKPEIIFWFLTTGMFLIPDSVFANSDYDTYFSFFNEKLI
jgi:hypothetical protein